MKHGLRLVLARLMIGGVLFFNLQCALAFLISPEVYVDSFEVSGVPGQAMIQGLGFLFLMWNVPYAAALIQPIRQRSSHLQAILMQAIGLAGETWLWIGLGSGHDPLHTTAFRFIQFDSVGLLALFAAFWLLRTERNTQPQA